MDIVDVLNIILPIVFILVGIALIVFIVELIKTLKVARGTVQSLEPTLKNVEEITTNIQPALDKVDPLMDRVQLTVDSLNLEMMRVDQILEDVSEITDTASSATAAVDNITNVPLKAVNSMADRVRSVFGGKFASDESAQLAEQRVAVAQALEEYKAAEGKTPKKEEAAKEEPAVEDADEGSNEGAVEEFKEVKVPESESAGDAEVPQSYVQAADDGQELVIDPKVIAESSFFDEGPNAK